MSEKEGIEDLWKAGFEIGYHFSVYFNGVLRDEQLLKGLEGHSNFINLENLEMLRERVNKNRTELLQLYTSFADSFVRNDFQLKILEYCKPKKLQRAYESFMKTYYKVRQRLRKENEGFKRYVENESRKIEKRRGALERLFAFSSK